MYMCGKLKTQEMSQSQKTSNSHTKHTAGNSRPHTADTEAALISGVNNQYAFATQNQTTHSLK